MKLRFAILCLLIFQVNACSSEKGRPLLIYRGDFDAQLSSQVAPILFAIANQRGMTVFEKDSEQMRILSQDQPAFFLAVYADEAPVLILTNVGAADILTLSVERGTSISDSQVQELAEQVRFTLAEELGITLTPADN